MDNHQNWDLLSVTKGTKFKVHREDFDANRVAFAFCLAGLKEVKIKMLTNWVVVKVKKA